MIQVIIMDIPQITFVITKVSILESGLVSD